MVNSLRVDTQNIERKKGVVCKYWERLDEYWLVIINASTGLENSMTMQKFNYYLVNM
jgi:hypothetical protein